MKNTIVFTKYHSKNIHMIQNALRVFEREFIYPLTIEQQFRISHGMSYLNFFQRLGNTELIVATHGEEIVGIIAVVQKKIKINHKVKNIYYLADLKIKKSFAHHQISQKFYQHLFWQSLKTPWRLINLRFFFVSMIGQRGDIRRSFRSAHMERWINDLGRIKIFFVEPKKLAVLPEESLMEEIPTIICLDSFPSSEEKHVHDMQGIKDIILHPQNVPLKLAHINTCGMQATKLITRLKQAGSEALEENYELCCFAVDVQRYDLLNFLEDNGIVTTSEAFIGGFRMSNRSQIISLNTAEI